MLPPVLGILLQAGFMAPCLPHSKRRKKERNTFDNFFFEDDDFGVSQFIGRLRNSEIAMTLRADELICRYIAQEIMKKGLHKGFQTTSNQVRLVAQLIEKVKTMTRTPTLTLQQLPCPQMFDALYKGIITLFRYSSTSVENDEISMNAPSSLIKLCQILMKICGTLHVHYLKQGQSRAAKQTLDESTLLDKELRPLMQNAMQNLRCASSGLPQELPPHRTSRTIKRNIEKHLERNGVDEKE